MTPDILTECGEDDEILAGIVINAVTPGHKGSDVEPPEDPELDYDIVDEHGELLEEGAIRDYDEQKLVEMAWDLLKARATDEP